MFEPGDLVRVCKQPPNQLVHLKGLVGFVDETTVLEGDLYVTLHTLNPDGTRSGSGSVPGDCLEPEPDLEWGRARDKAIGEMFAHERRRLGRAGGVHKHYGAPGSKLELLFSNE